MPIVDFCKKENLIEEPDIIEYTGCITGAFNMILVSDNKLKTLEKNIEGIIVGKAIYDGDISLQELVKEIDA